MFNTRNKLKLFCASALIALSSQAEATLINFDLTSATNADKYSTGPGAFGTATSQWNEFSRASSATNLALTDDTGAATSVTVSYTRAGSGTGVVASTFAAIGTSSITGGPVTFSGLVANGNYELAIFSGWSGAPSFSVNGVTKALSRSSDWSTLTEGVQYVLFQAVADAAGQLTFTANANPTASNFTANSAWSAFQLQDVAVVPPATVPEPTSLVLVGIALAGFGFSQRHAKKV